MGSTQPKIPNEVVMDIYNNEYLAGTAALVLEQKYGLGRGYLYRRFTRLNLPLRSNKINSKKYTFNEDYFEKIDTEDKAYWLGFIYADGFIQSKRKHNSRKMGISLAIKDRGHLVKLNECLESSVPVKEYVQTTGYSVGSTYCRVLYASEKLTDDLMRYGVFENKTDILDAPPDIPKQYIKDFIRGYFDGDGSVWRSKSNNQCHISIVGTDALLTFIMNHLKDEGVIERMYPLEKRKKHQTVSYFRFGGRIIAYKFLKYIYENAHTYLDRKYDIYSNYEQYRSGLPIQQCIDKKLCEPINVGCIIYAQEPQEMAVRDYANRES